MPTPKPTTEPDEAVLLEEATRFLLGGGTISWREWTSLTPIERRALATAGESLLVTQAARIGLCTEGPGGRATALAVIDGGRARGRSLLTQALGAIAGRSNADEPLGVD